MTAMDEKVIPILIESLGINRRYRGHDIAVGAIRRLGNSEGVAAYSLHRNVYEPLARDSGCNTQQIERNLRTVIQRAWCVNPEGLQSICPYPLQAAPTTGEFLDILVTHLLRKHPEAFERKSSD
jgi:hypothetical protein